MARTATRVAAAVGATVVLMGLATPALACTDTVSGGPVSTVNADQAKNDPGKSFHGDKKKSSLTLAELQAKIDAKIADRLAWVDAVEAKVSDSDRISDEQKTAFLAHLQAKEDALTALRADVAAATSVDGVKAALKAADAGVFGHWGWNHGKHHGNCNHRGGFGGRHHDGGFGGDRDSRHGGTDRSSNDRSSFHGGGHNGGFHR